MEQSKHDLNDFQTPLEHTPSQSIDPTSKAIEPKSNQCLEKAPSSSYWKVWKTIQALEEKTSSLFETKNPSHHNNYNLKNGMKRECIRINGNKYDALADETAEILRDWANKWAGLNQWQSFLNKSSLLHEVEESIVTIQSLLDWLNRTQIDTEANSKSNSNSNPSSHTSTLVLLDVCCGKGVCSMLLTFLAARPKYASLLERVKYCVMMDKAKKTQISWNHIHEANRLLDQINHNKNENENKNKNENKNENENENGVAFPIEIWDDCNIHEEDFFDRLNNFEIPPTIHSFQSTQKQNLQFAMIGIHLCKTLSPRCISLFNMLGSKKAPFLCLAPCCLPRFSYKSKFIIPINLYQTFEERAKYQELLTLRNQAIGRKRQKTTKFGKASVIQEGGPQPCWKCGKLGHFKKDCPTIFRDEEGNVITSSRPPRPKNPHVVDLDVDLVKNSTQPFETYCELLSKTVQTQTYQEETVDNVLMNSPLMPFYDRKANIQEALYKNKKQKNEKENQIVTNGGGNDQHFNKVNLVEVHMAGNAHSGKRMKKSHKDDKSIKENWNANRKSTWIIQEFVQDPCFLIKFCKHYQSEEAPTVHNVDPQLR